MAYDQNTPRPTETPAQSQPLIAGNFLQIANSYNTDHIPLTSGGNVGFSNKLTLVDQGGSPPGGVVGSDVLYSKTVSALIEIFMQRPAGGAIQLTSGLASGGTNGQSFLPGGFQIKWGQQAGVNSTTTPINFVASGLANFPTNTLVAFAIGFNQNRTYNVNAFANTGFNAISSTSMAPGDLLLWFAIGN